MVDRIPFKMRLTGGSSGRHEFQGYDGYMALAGFARTLSLVANYTETGTIRQRGEYKGRGAVRASVPVAGSVVADFFVVLQSNPAVSLGLSSTIAAAPVFYSLIKRVINKNIGDETALDFPEMEQRLQDRSGDIDTLVAVSEAPIRQTHQVIGNGAERVQVVGGASVLNTFDRETKEYVRRNVEDREIVEKQVSVSAFNANSGSGSVYDSDLGRNVAFQIDPDILPAYQSVISWGLDQYANRSGAKISIRFWRILTMDARPKKYMILQATL